MKQLLGNHREPLPAGVGTKGWKEVDLLLSMHPAMAGDTPARGPEQGRHPDLFLLPSPASCWLLLWLKPEGKIAQLPRLGSARCSRVENRARRAIRKYQAERFTGLSLLPQSPPGTFCSSSNAAL